MFLKPISGSASLIDLTYRVNSLRNFPSDTQRNILKSPLRFAIAFLSLQIFTTLGIFFNVSIGISKGGLALLSFKNRKSIFGIRYAEYAQESKQHFIKALADLVLSVVRVFSSIIFALYPEGLLFLEKYMEKIFL